MRASSMTCNWDR